VTDRPDLAEQNFRSAIKVAINDLHEISATDRACTRYRADHLIAILKALPDVHWGRLEYIRSIVEWCAARRERGRI
jgi:hypothetical protein